MSQPSGHDEQQTTKPWYRQFWPWFLIALPATSVVAGLTTLGIAIKNQDSLVRDDWYKDGKAINQSFARDDVAVAQGISVSMAIDSLTGELSATVTGKDSLKMPDTLTLSLSHPTLAEKDQTIILTRRGDGQFHGALAHSLQGPHYIELGTAEWRLRGSRDFPVDTLSLHHE